MEKAPRNQVRWTEALGGMGLECMKQRWKEQEKEEEQRDGTPIMSITHGAKPCRYSYCKDGLPCIGDIGH